MADENGEKRKRRGRGEGSIYYREDTGKFEARVSYIDGEGKRQRPTVTGDTKKEVQRKLDDLRQRAGGGAGAMAAERKLMSVYLDEWLERCKVSTSPNTYVGYEKHVRLYLRRLVGQYTLGRLTSDNVEDLFTKAERRGGFHRPASEDRRHLERRDRQGRGKGPPGQEPVQGRDVAD